MGRASMLAIPFVLNSVTILNYQIRSLNSDPLSQSPPAHDHKSFGLKALVGDYSVGSSLISTPLLHTSLYITNPLKLKPDNQRTPELYALASMHARHRRLTLAHANAAQTHKIAPASMQVSIT